MGLHLTKSQQDDVRAIKLFTGCGLFFSFYLAKLLGHLAAPLIATILGGASWRYFEDRVYHRNKPSHGWRPHFDPGFEALPDYVGYALFLLLAVTIIVAAKSSEPKPAQNPAYRDIPTLDVELVEILLILKQDPTRLLTSYFLPKDHSSFKEAPLRPFFLSFMVMFISLLIAAAVAGFNPSGVFAATASPLRYVVLLAAVLPGLGMWIWSLAQLGWEHRPHFALLIDRGRRAIEVVDLAASASTGPSEVFAFSDITTVGLLRYYEKDQYRSSYIKLNRGPGQEALGLLSSAEKSDSEQVALALADYLQIPLLEEKALIPDKHHDD